MYVDHLTLADFRSYPAVDVELQAGVVTFVGSNGQGKTNLVEAIEYLSTLGSHRVASDAPLVRLGAERAVVRARVRAGIADDRALVLEIEISPGKANRARLNRAPLGRPRELLGVLRSVVFSPLDLDLIRGDPSERRRFIDGLLVARWPRLAGVKADYDRVLRQRNTLLKTLGGRYRSSADANSTLDVWDGQLAQTGAELLHARLATLAELMPYASSSYAEIAPTNNVALASYKTSIALGGDGEDFALADADVPERARLAELLLEKLAERRGDEIQRGLSLVGPHRDDIVLHLGQLPAKGYASHGESWSYALALRLGSFALLRSDGIEPILVLDDVFAELDTTRRQRLAASVAGAEQVFVTAAVAADVPEILRGVRYAVADGTVTRVDEIA